EEIYEPIDTESTESLFWEVTFFLENGEDEGEYDLGVKLKPTDDEWDIEAVEFFFHSPYGSLNYQDLDIQNFEGEITYSEPCPYCTFYKEEIGAEMFGDFYADITINWK